MSRPGHHMRAPHTDDLETCTPLLRAKEVPVNYMRQQEIMSLCSPDPRLVPRLIASSQRTFPPPRGGN